MNYIGKLLSQGLSNLNWTIQSMDITQWGIVSVIMVVVGFMALRSRL